MSSPSYEAWAQANLPTTTAPTGQGLPWGDLIQAGASAIPAMMQPGQVPAANPMLNEAALQAAIDDLARYQQGQEALYGTPSYAPGGTSVVQAQKIPGKESKKEAYQQYLIGQGVDPVVAKRKANKLKFRDDKGFRKAIRSGEFEDQGLFLDDGKIKARPRFTPGGATVSDESEMMTDALRALGMSGVAGMQRMFGEGFNQQGLLPSQQRSLDDLKARYLDEFSDVYRDTTRGALGELVGSGTIKSSFAPGFIADTAGRAQSRFLTQALGELAGREEQMLTGRAARQAQALQNYRGGIMSPGAAGLFTDPQSAQFAANLQQQNILNRAQDQAAMTGLMSTPRSGSLATEEDDGFNWGGALAGGVTGFLTGGPAGAVAGGLGGGLS